VCQTGCDSHPQVCVDMCDAKAFCAAVGKRLCGRIGGTSVTDADTANIGASQWHNACSSHGANAFSYGSTYDAEACHGSDDWAGTGVGSVATASMSACQSGVPEYAGVFDMTGNVREWEDSCQGPEETDACVVRGGSFYSAAAGLSCGGVSYSLRQVASEQIGFRCCSR
ncbi:MAG TPA: SUMF1/EgtB/PvdO family nonheme iron enzyme, partial [Polyangiaceae bacterium]